MNLNDLARVWQIIKPSKKLNFTLGITFVCISSYLILAFLSDILQIVSLSHPMKQLMVYGGLFVFGNFVMALWIIKNSLNKSSYNTIWEFPFGSGFR